MTQINFGAEAQSVFFYFILLDYLINLLGGNCLAVWVKKKVLESY